MANPTTDEIVAILRHCSEHNCIMCPAFNPPNSSTCFATLKAACDRLEELETEQPRWIPVTERLPEHPSDVLALWADGGMVIAEYYQAIGFTSAENGLDLNNITHWMPLPAPPKEGDPK